MNSLGFKKDPGDTRVVVAMSGGVDSSVAAALLQEQGYDVIGVTLQLYDDAAATGKTGKTCCAGQDIHDAKRLAAKLGFPHYVLNYESAFRDSVVEDFAESYMRGQTPVPCVRCNQSVKFRDLLKVSLDLGADCMATGHYIRRHVNDSGRAELHRAVENKKDQSYFLFATTQAQLEFLRFPLGGWRKEVTRGHARRLGLLIADKPESQDICFVPHGDYARVVKTLRPDADKAGNIVDLQGRKIGKHQGIVHYTIGQRKGLGIGGGINEDNSPFYVVSLNPDKNEVVVGPKEALARDVIFIKECNWMIPGTSEAGLAVSVKFRSVMNPVPARLFIQAGGDAKIHLSAPQYGISPGQAAVAYDGSRILGGGWIVRTDNEQSALAA